MLVPWLKTFTRIPVYVWALSGVMTLVIATSNVLYTFPIGSWLTWGAFSYPLTFFVTDVTNRFFNESTAKKVTVIGFICAVILSNFLAGPRIAIASGSAFLCAQLLDIAIFSSLRHASWWRAPLISSVIASLLDSCLFFSIAFAFTDVPWLQLALGDQIIKWLMAGILLPLYYLAISRYSRVR